MYAQKLFTDGGDLSKTLGTTSRMRDSRERGIVVNPPPQTDTVEDVYKELD